MKVLISDNLSPIGVQILEEAGLEVDVKTGLSPEELKAIIPEYDGLVIRSASKVTEEIIAAGEKLKVVGRAGIGLDNVNIPAASKKGIIVMNAPDGNATTAAEHAIAMMMSLTRNIPQATATKARETSSGARQRVWVDEPARAKMAAMAPQNASAILILWPDRP